MNVKARILASAAVISAVATATNAQDVVLRHSNWFPEGQALREQVIEPWAEDVAKVTDGRVVVEMAPKVIGSVPAQFDIVHDGQADSSVWVNGYTPGRFVVTDLFELPFMSDKTDIYNGIMYEFYKENLESYDEFDGVHVLALFSPGAGDIYNTKHEITSLDGFNGLQIRSPQKNVTESLELLGATPVQKPISEMYELLSAGIVDGTVLVTESVPAFKLDELLPYALQLPGGLYNSVLVLGVNEDTWAKISPEDQKAIEEISGVAFGQKAGEVYLDGSAKAQASMEERELTTFTVASPEFLAEIKETLKPVEEQWIAAAKERGIEDPTALIESLRAKIDESGAGTD